MRKFIFLYTRAPQGQLPKEKCYYCERWIGTRDSSGLLKRSVDHVRPKSKHVYSNILVVCCHFCNTSKGDLEPEIFLEKLKISLENQSDFSNIPHAVLSNVIKNTTVLLEKKIKPLRNYPVTMYLNCCSIHHLRGLARDQLGDKIVNQLHDHFFLDLKIIMLGTLKYVPKLLLEIRHRNISKNHFDKLIQTLKDLGWIIEFGSDSIKKSRRRYYALSNSGKKALLLDPE